MNICIFMVNGNTFSFKDIDSLEVNENAISFNYTAMSDGKEKTAVFFWLNVGGYSTHDI